MNLRTLIPFVAAAWATLPAAAQLPPATPTFNNVQWATGVPTHNGTVNLEMDVYVPPVSGGATRKPCLLFLHGGGWSLSNNPPNGHPDLGAYFAPYLTPSDIVVASTGYRVLPTHPGLNFPPGCPEITANATFPAAIRDVKGAVRYLRANAAAYSIDAGRIAVWGLSAGGELATLLAYTADDSYYEGDTGDAVGGGPPGNTNQSSRVSAVVGYFPWTDFLPIATEYLPTVTPGILHDDYASFGSRYLGFHGTNQGLGVLRQDWLAGSPNYPCDVTHALQASPYRQVSPDDPPTWLIHGELDPLVPVMQSQKLHLALVGSGVSSTYTELTGNNVHHAPPIVTGGAYEAQAVQWLLQQFAAAPTLHGYGKGKPNTLGTTASLSSTGTATPGGNFTVHVNNAKPNSTGSFVWGHVAQNLPYLGGTLWVVPSLTGSGNLSIDGSGHASWTPNISGMLGQSVHFQFVYRDVGQTDGTNTALSNAGWAVVSF